MTPAADNEAKYQYMAPLLADPANKPSQAQVKQASAQAADLLRLRFSTPLFRLGEAEQIKQKVGYPVSGTSLMQPGVIVQHIDDTVGADADPRLDGLVVVYNASAKQVTQQVPQAKGQGYRLSPVQAGGADAAVKTSSFDPASGSFTVPARTVAVFVQPAGQG
ncbi:alpha-1,6-glucosidase domain-containing protein [Luteococcus sp. OSA5]|uniref:alpha-1,6-glucosidase domain-containing protein n=1 Tax=Luteococcus sp. OSA5 TaxID=3401630 RepID=UPI003B431678